MPYIGLLPFLRNSDETDKTGKEVCQCPISGFSHFYEFYSEWHKDVFGVNALYRASPISTFPAFGKARNL